ncbi:hypothetical protein IWQ62_003500 [Dispira parvispora]|uniref:Uncharacterized protein n=1 Tax=Dispira parvispora TaxID=1520584 RepID=A0A9W8AUQ1_9FUNG|nr:hypothetical protein IWQ62_003500 [Dispira parvispora]
MARFSAVVFACIAVASVSALPWYANQQYGNQQNRYSNSATNFNAQAGVNFGHQNSRGNYGQQYAPQQRYGNYAQGGGSSVGGSQAYGRW